MAADTNAPPVTEVKYWRYRCKRGHQQFIKAATGKAPSQIACAGHGPCPGHKAGTQARAYFTGAWWCEEVPAGVTHGPNLVPLHRGGKL